jgi:hypothetical protein
MVMLILIPDAKLGQIETKMDNWKRGNNVAVARCELDFMAGLAQVGRQMRCLVTTDSPLTFYRSLTGLSPWMDSLTVRFTSLHLSVHFCSQMSYLSVHVATEL